MGTGSSGVNGTSDQAVEVVLLTGREHQEVGSWNIRTSGNIRKFRIKWIQRKFRID
jgi:hypothetical protein